MTAPRTLPENPRIAVIGDSSIAGYGVNGKSYAEFVGAQLYAERVMCYARSTFTVLDALRLLDRVKAFKPDLILMNVGGSDSLVHASQAVERLLDRFAPKSWQGVYGLEPAVHVEPERLTRARQRITGLVKLVLKHIGVRINGGFRRVEPDLFESTYRELVSGLTTIGCPIVAVAVQRVDPFLWPRTAESMIEFDAASERVLRDYPNVIRVDPRPVLAYWDDYLEDHAHFAMTGHRKVANLVLQAVEGKLAPPRSA